MHSHSGPWGCTRKTARLMEKVPTPQCKCSSCGPAEAEVLCPPSVWAHSSRPRDRQASRVPRDWGSEGQSVGGLTGAVAGWDRDCSCGGFKISAESLLDGFEQAGPASSAPLLPHPLSIVLRE